MRAATACTLVRIWLVALFASGSAWAQSDETTSSVPLDRFRPTIDDRGLLTTEGGDVVGHREVQGGVVLNYALNPLDGTDADLVRLHTLLDEALLGVRWRLLDSVVVDGGVGTGVLAGFGTPDLRIFVGIRSSAVRDDDDDDDGLADALDRCTDAPEDHDRFADDDGCPDDDDDNDADGVPDRGDACPDIPEDRDGFLDGDGCVDDDNDGDAVKDGDDRCPDLAGEAMSRGCPSDAWIPSADDAADNAADRSP
jgi:hypothetical protein